MPKPLIIFDLDGTLAHTGPDLLGTLNRVTTPHGIAPLALTDLGYVLGQGAKAMITRSFELANFPLAEEKREELFQAFLADYEQNICNETKLFDGLLLAMDVLASNGHEFAVCTNKSERLARILLDKLGVSGKFKALTGGDTFEFRKPDARHLEETAKLAGADLSNTIMIGDSKSDIGAARNAGVPSVAVTFGYTDIPPHELGATKVISHFDQLVPTIDEICSMMS